ncbi:serine/threonine-protein kinase RsbW [Jatrophihabitans sp. GAS493]|uniref:ATP-binding protein n=1 Tax=Jatrophihabitans sp. GAS493 TaxID=1907575 RepID=UPI000BB99FB3|nr:ATP-binding protein [Jatrophihabitans sp. GAS493]SOD73255.1 serine/threonine-protein kinase RsbW [Jatrophihabitans sp. GAS493]
MTESQTLPDEVELTLPAKPEYISVLRSLTATLAARCDLTVDEIDDLRIAVDEAVGLLLPHASGDTPLKSWFRVSSGGIEITTSVCAEPGAEPDRVGFAWTVLEAVSDELDVEHQGEELTIRLTKRRQILTP